MAKRRKLLALSPERRKEIEDRVSELRELEAELTQLVDAGLIHPGMLETVKDSIAQQETVLNLTSS